MSEIRPFNPSGEPCTCLWCGKRFSPEARWRELGYFTTCCDTPAPEGFRVEKYATGAPSKHEQREPCASCGSFQTGYRLKGENYHTGRRVGYGGSEYFCTLRCGFAFAERMAELGRRLVRAKGKDWVGNVPASGDKE